MKTRTALTILIASSSFMALGLGIGLANAQDDQRPSVRVRRNGPTPAKQAGADDAAGSPGALPQFETGIDYQPISPRARVTFNLEDADLPDLVRLISNITGKRFIIPGKVRSIKATVFSPTKVSVAEAYNAFLSILNVNGMTVVPSGRYLKIAETSGIESQPIPTYTGNSPTPSSDRFITRLHRVDNVAAEDVATLLSRFKSREGNITAYAPTNTIIITDTGTQIRRMLRLIEAIDVPRTGEQIWIEPIHYATASDLAARLQEIFQASGGSGSAGAAKAAPARPARARGRAAKAAKAAQTNAAAGPSTVGSRSGESRITNILADERTNSLIILATERAYLRIMELIRQLDVPLEGEGRIHVHYVQNGDATEIAGTLTSLIGGPSGGGGAGAARRGAAAAAAPATDLFEGQIRVTAHEATNALVITSSLHDYAALRRVIERLDSPRRQVFIEAVVMELSVSRSTNLGLAFHGGVPDAAAEGGLSVFGFNAIQSATFPNQDALTGLAVGVRGPAIEGIAGATGLSIPGFGVVLNAISSSGETNILSTPHIIAMDNVQAEISVGENIPLQTSGLALGGAGGGLGGLAGLAGLAGGQQGGAGGLAGLAGLAGGLGGGAAPRQDIGTTIRLTPHVNENDEIRLEIEEEISERGVTEGTLGVVSITRRTAKTEVMVRDQQTVVIGGLIRETVVTSEEKIPILGDIPLLGALFRNTERQKRKTNLLLFLTPYIIRDPSDLRSIFERKMRERQEFLDRYFVFGDRDYEPPTDYSRTRGLVAEIINEIDEIDTEARLEAEARAAPPPDHVPRPPVGSYEFSPEAGGDVVISPGTSTIPVPPPDSASVGTPVTVTPTN